MRQQLGDVGESTSSTCAAFSPCTLNCDGLAPSTFATKFYGFYVRSGNCLSPYAASLFTSGAEVGAYIYGRTFGDWVLYQVGILNGAYKALGD